MRITHIAGASALALVALPVSAQAPSDPPPPAEAPAFDRAAWLADYAGLKDAMARGYANLDWIVERRGLDLAELDRTTTARLEAATGVPDAVAAISAFTAAFGDNHLRGARGRAHPAALRNAAATGGSDDDAAAPDEDEPRSQDCAALGYRDRDRGSALQAAGLPDWSGLSSPWFAAGHSGQTGFIRIHSFDETDYLAACEAAWQPGRTARETQLATRAALQAELTRLAGELRAASVHLLALDLTGNGGGSEWSEEAAALFTARELTRPSPRMVVEPRCDRAGVWRGEPVCANLASAGEVDRMPGLGAWQGPLAVLVDGRSASAAEDFAYWLSGSGVARLVGERTFGAGCGYMDGGWAYQFRAIDGHVMMPNCARYTAEGVNQIEGLEPDVAFDWSASPGEIAAALDQIAE